ncbi:MAG: DUF2007 domain-containing protein, partial [Actinomycetota bacterium]|nr:DUF2007 domain-containing protein [Actinomycetota bacterium]
GMPLVYSGRAGEQPITETHERARKIKPQYSRGEPVKVAFARNQAEGEMVQGILLDEGIPSMLRRNHGFDVPYLAAGPRDILVPEAGAEAARHLLADIEMESEDDEIAELRGQAKLSGSGPTSPARLAFWVLVALAAAFAIVWLLYQATS